MGSDCGFRLRQRAGRLAVVCKRPAEHILCGRVG
jgi:hypothetical protein